MKYVDRELKGTYGYIRKQMIFEIIKTVILFAMALGIFFIGLMTLHTKKSLWSVFAVLALLPACKSLVGVIMFARFSSLSAEEYDRYSQYTGNLPVLYENIITTSEKTFFVPLICSVSGNVIAYVNKKGDHRLLKDHLMGVLKAAGHSASVMIFEDETAFANRCRDLREKFTSSETGDHGILNTIKAVSL